MWKWKSVAKGGDGVDVLDTIRYILNLLVDLMYAFNLRHLSFWLYLVWIEIR